MTESTKTYRPEDLASSLGVTGKVLRGWLRVTYPRPVESKGTTWVVTQDAADAAREYFAKRRTVTSDTPSVDMDAWRDAEQGA